MPVPIGVARFRRRHEGLNAVGGHHFDVVERGETTIREMLTRSFAILLGPGIVHRCHLAHARGDVVDRHSGNDGACGVCRELDIVGWSEATAGHLYDPCLRIGRGSTRLIVAWLFGLQFRSCARRRLAFGLLRLPGRTLGGLGGTVTFLARLLLLAVMEFLGHLQRLTNPSPAILGRPQRRRGLLEAGGSGIGFNFRAQIVQRLLRLGPSFLRGRMPTKRCRPAEARTCMPPEQPHPGWPRPPAPVR